jgi:large subunit ribosomal protein L4
VATVKKYNLKGDETGEAELNDAIAGAQASSQTIKEYIVAIRRNARQWSACTKGRSEVNHSGQKPHKQKGTGKARQGCLAAPQYKGGGRVFGPKPKFDQHVRINRKERQQAIRALLGEKFREQRLRILDDPEMAAPKTAEVATFLKKVGLEGRVLFLGQPNVPFSKSVRNLPKARFALANQVSGYDLAKAKEIVITASAFAELQERAS